MHGEEEYYVHYFNIGTEKFHCESDDNNLWFPWVNSHHQINSKRNFESKQECEAYMKQQIKHYCKHLLLNLKEKNE